MTRSRSTRVMVVGLAVLAASSFAACATSVNKVLADPSQYRNREVTLSGDVLDSYSFGTRGAYRISDHTGELWVVSDKGVPRKGARVKVTGTIKEGFNLGGLGDRLKMPAGVGSGLVMIEREHKAT
jgi:hypothetical protein